MNKNNAYKILSTNIFNVFAKIIVDKDKRTWRFMQISKQNSG